MARMTNADYDALPAAEQADIQAWFAEAIPDRWCMEATAEDDAVVLHCVPKDPEAHVIDEDAGDLVYERIAFPHATVPEPIRSRVFR